MNNIYAIIDRALDEPDLNSFLSRLEDFTLRFYIRGKNPTVQHMRTGTRYRLRTLGLYQKYLSRWPEWGTNDPSGAEWLYK